MNYDYLKTCLEKGMSAREIGVEVNLCRRTISYWCNKYELNDLNIHKKRGKFDFNVIDTKEKAYVLGFILADGHIDNNNGVSIAVAKADAEVVEFIGNIVDSRVCVDNKYLPDKRHFPHAGITKHISDITKFTGGRLKEERHYPRVRDDVERYLLQGLFDADGCITWGVRKDKKRIWQKVSFTSQYNILRGVQQYLTNKLSISTVLRPKSQNEKCFVLEFCNKANVLKFLNHIYPDDSFIILNRKYVKYNALRLELEDNGESTKM